MAVLPRQTKERMLLIQEACKAYPVIDAVLSEQAKRMEALESELARVEAELSRLQPFGTLLGFDLYSSDRPQFLYDPSSGKSSFEQVVEFIHEIRASRPQQTSVTMSSGIARAVQITMREKMTR